LKGTTVSLIQVSLSSLASICQKNVTLATTAGAIVMRIPAGTVLGA